MPEVETPTGLDYDEYPGPPCPKCGGFTKETPVEGRGWVLVCVDKSCGWRKQLTGN